MPTPKTSKLLFRWHPIRHYMVGSAYHICIGTKLMYWDKVGKRKLNGLKIIQEMNEHVMIIREKVGSNSKLIKELCRHMNKRIVIWKRWQLGIPQSIAFESLSNSLGWKETQFEVCGIILDNRKYLPRGLQACIIRIFWRSAQCVPCLLPEEEFWTIGASDIHHDKIQLQLNLAYEKTPTHILD